MDDWWRAKHPPQVARGPGRPTLLSESEVLTLAIVAQRPRFRSERDLRRYAEANLRPYFPTLCSHSRFDRRARALESEMRALQPDKAGRLTDPGAVYRVVDTTPVPAIERVRAGRNGLFAGQAAFGRNVSKTEWVYGFKMALVVDPYTVGQWLNARLGRPLRHLTDLPVASRNCATSVLGPSVSRSLRPGTTVARFATEASLVVCRTWARTAPGLLQRPSRGSPSRPEVDFAACLAMCAAGYTETEVWSVMADPAHGISEKYLEKGRHGDAYLSLTVGKARALVRWCVVLRPPRRVSCQPSRTPA